MIDVMGVILFIAGIYHIVWISIDDIFNRKQYYHNNVHKIIEYSPIPFLLLLLIALLYVPIEPITIMFNISIQLPNIQIPYFPFLLGYYGTVIDVYLLDITLLFDDVIHQKILE